MTESASTDVVDPQKSEMESHYWMSYAFEYNMNEGLYFDIFRLTIILDRQLHAEYTKVRLIIVVEPCPYDTSDSYEVVIKATPWDASPWQRQVRLFKYSHPSNVFQTRRIRRRPIAEADDQGKVCTVVLLLSWRVQISLLYHSLGPFTGKMPSSRNRIVFDKTYGLADSQPSLHLLLQSSCSFGDEVPRYPQKATIRIFPTSRMPSLPSLTAKLQHDIARMAVADVPQRILPKAIVSLALVSKSWLGPALNLFYEIPGLLPPHILYARLRKNPSSCGRMRAFNIQHINPLEDPELGVDEDSMPEDQVEELVRRVLDISFLRRGRDIAALTLNWEFFLLANEEGVLGDLRKVERLTLNEWRSEAEGPVNVVLDAIRGWTELKEISFSKLGREDASVSTNLGRPCGYQLRVLHISQGFLNGLYLSHFISHPEPVLVELDLQFVQGLVNADLSAFFSVTAPSLVTIRIQDCGIKPPTTPRDEEFALEAHISRMTRLKEVVIPGMCCTYYILSRKTESSGNATWRGNTRIQIDDARWTIMFRGQKDGKRLMREAVGRTGWRDVRINPERAEGFWGCAVDREVEELARKRGVGFVVEGVTRSGFRY